MFQKGRFDFDRADAVGGDLDDLVRPAGKPEVAVFVDMGRIACVVALCRPRAWRSGLETAA
jgi:hypothetical protein